MREISLIESEFNLEEMKKELTGDKLVIVNIRDQYGRFVKEYFFSIKMKIKQITRKRYNEPRSTIIYIGDKT